MEFTEKLAGNHDSPAANFSMLGRLKIEPCVA